MKRIKCLCVLCGVYLVWAVPRASGQDLDTDKSGWIDPTDMLNYDPSTKSMKNARATRQDEKKDVPASDAEASKELPIPTCPSCPQCPAEKELAEAQQRLAQCQQKRDGETEDTGACQVPSSVDAHIYMRQYIRSLLGFIPLVPEGMKEDMNIGITLSSEDIKLLERYTQEAGSIQDAHGVLAQMIQEVSLRDSGYGVITRFERQFGFDPWTLSQLFLSCGVMCLGIYVLMKLRPSLLQLSFNLLLLMFLVSVPWNWWHLYKLELAKRHSEIIKDIPAECNPKHMSYQKSFSEVFRYWFSFSEDECTKYHQKLMVDPMWEVAPTKALAVTVTKFFVEPLEHIGGAISKFVQATLRDLPVQLWPVVIIIVLVIFVFVLVLMCGYRVNILGPLVGIEPTYRPVQVQEVAPPAQPAVQGPTLSQQEIHDSIQKGLQKEIHRLTETIGAQQQPSIEAPTIAAQGPPMPQPDMPQVAMPTPPYPTRDTGLPPPPVYSSVTSGSTTESSPYPATVILRNLPDTEAPPWVVSGGEYRQESKEGLVKTSTDSREETGGAAQQSMQSESESSVSAAENIEEVIVKHQTKLMQDAEQRMPDRVMKEHPEAKGQGDTDCKVESSREKDNAASSAGEGDHVSSSAEQGKTGNGETDSDDDFVTIEEIGHNNLSTLSLD